ESVRRRPDLHRPLLDGFDLRLWRGCGVWRGARRRRHVPGVGAADDLHRALLDGRGAHASRLDDLGAHHLHTGGGCLVVDARLEAADVECRPGKGRARRLTELEPLARPRVLDRLQVVGAKGTGGRLERARFLLGTPHRRQEHRESGKNGDSAHGRLLSRAPRYTLFMRGAETPTPELRHRGASRGIYTSAVLFFEYGVTS